MKFAGQFAVGLLAAVTISSPARAGDQATAGNPYLAISERNVFALVPIPVVTNTPIVEPGEPPPKITPNGIMSLFGQLQVLFKVAVPPKAGKPAADLSYVMAAGERQDDITVVKIDQPAQMITFNNHGAIQELPLADAPKLTTPAVPAGGPGVWGIPLPAGMAAGGLNPAAAARLARAAGGVPNPAAAAGSGAAEGGGLGAAATEGSKQIYNPAVHDEPGNSNPEVAAAKMAVNYLEAKKKDPAKAALFPLSAQDKKDLETAAEQ